MSADDGANTTVATVSKEEVKFYMVNTDELSVVIHTVKCPSVVILTVVS